MQTRTIIIGVIILILALAGWRIWAGSVDRTKPDAVATAFLSALKSNNVSKAAKYWVPDGADAWRTGALAKIESMGSGTYSRFFEDLPSGTPVFSTSRHPKQPTNEQTLTTSGASVDLRQLEGKWYICKGPI